MSGYRGRREFRPAGAVITYRQRGWSWVSLTFAGATILGLGAILESLILRIQLTDDALVVADLRGRRRYPMRDIARVEEAKGVSPMLVMADGRAVRLPSVGSNLGNSVRAWLKGSSLVPQGLGRGTDHS